MYFSDNPSDRYYERMMVGIPNFKPRGHGVVIVGSRPTEPLVILRIQDGSATHREILTETTKAINHRRFRHRLKAALNEKLNMILEFIDEQPEVSITYFEPDKRKAGGAYVTVTGTVKRIDEYEHLVIMTDGKKINIDEIYNLQSELFYSLGLRSKYIIRLAVYHIASAIYH